MRKVILFSVFAFVAVSSALALDPPAKMWEKWYYTQYDYAYFRDIELTPSADLFVTCLVYDYGSSLENYVALLLDQDGDVIWEVPHEFAGASGFDGEALPDGSFIVVGSAHEHADSSLALYVHKIGSDGTTEWVHVYDYPETKEEAYGVTVLPDGGYAVCGRVNGTGSILGQAWTLRTDANGDTLWTDVWGTYPMNYAKRAFYDEGLDLLVVAVFGKSDDLPTNGPHLLYFDLDGTYEAGTGYPSLGAEVVRGFCASADGGYTILSRYGTGMSAGTLTHTDAYGEILWSEPVQAIWNNDNLGLGFAPYDGGYVCCGQWPEPGCLQVNAPVAQADTGNTQDGWLMRYSPDGELMWGIQNEMGHDNHFYSAVQLPEGGYIAAGTYTGSGYLVRYSAETGIEEEGPSPPAVLSVSPNPFSSAVEISFSLAAPSEVRLSVYDLSGRLVKNLFGGNAASGPMSCWLDGSQLPTGVYLARLQAGEQSATVRLVKL